MSQICKITIRVSAETLFLFRERNVCGAASPLSLPLGSYLRNYPFSETCQRAYLCVLFMKYVAVYRIGVIRSGNCMYDVPSRNLVAFGTRLSETRNDAARCLEFIWPQYDCLFTTQSFTHFPSDTETQATCTQLGKTRWRVVYVCVCVFCARRCVLVEKSNKKKNSKEKM